MYFEFYLKSPGYTVIRMSHKCVHFTKRNLNLLMIRQDLHESTLELTEMHHCQAKVIAGTSELGGQGEQLPTHFFASPFLKRNICPPTFY